MKERPIQYFSDEYLQRCKSMTPLQILEFLEDFRVLMFMQQEEQKKKTEPKDPSI